MSKDWSFRRTHVDPFDVDVTLASLARLQSTAETLFEEAQQQVDLEARNEQLRVAHAVEAVVAAAGVEFIRQGKLTRDQVQHAAADGDDRAIRDR